MWPRSLSAGPAVLAAQAGGTKICGQKGYGAKAEAPKGGTAHAGGGTGAGVQAAPTRQKSYTRPHEHALTQ
eukprot:3075468-Pyramimonas_sp.AAC.1